MVRSLLVVSLALPFSIQAQLPVQEIGQHDKPVAHVAFGPKGKVLYTASGDGKVVAWEIAKGERKWECQAGPNLLSIGGIGVDAKGTKVTYLLPGTTVVGEIDAKDGAKGPAVGGPNPTAQGWSFAADPKGRWVWVGADKGLLFRLNPDDVNGWSRRNVGGGNIRSLAAGSKGKWLAAGADDGAIRVVKASNADLELKFEAHEGPVVALAYDPSATMLFSGGEDKAVRVWSAAKGKMVRELAGHEQEILVVAVDPKKKWVASADKGGTIRLWKLKDGAPAQNWQDEGVRTLAFARDGKTLASAGGDSAVRLWDLSDL